MSDPRIKIAGEWFHLEREGRRVYLKHEQWSLVGAGRTFAAAYRDLLLEAGEIARVLANFPPVQLADDTVALMRYAFKIGCRP